MNRFDINCWSVPLLVKCRITCLHVTLRDLKTSVVSLLMTLSVDGQHIASL